MDRRQVCAVHEAGHVVAGRFFGLKVDCASINPAPASDGRVVFHDLSALPTTVVAVVRAAGDQAVRLAREGRAVPAARERPSRPVPAAAGAIPRWMDGPSERAKIRRAVGRAGERVARRSARGIVAESWDDVRTVAAALLERGRLDGADVEELLRPAEGYRSPRYGVRYSDPSATTPGLWWGRVDGRSQIRA